MHVVKVAAWNRFRLKLVAGEIAWMFKTNATWEDKIFFVSAQWAAFKMPTYSKKKLHTWNAFVCVRFAFNIEQ